MTRIDTISAHFSTIRHNRGMVELTHDASGEWRGSFQVNLPRAYESSIGLGSEAEWAERCRAQLYEEAYKRASTEAHLHGGVLGRFTQAAA